MGSIDGISQAIGALQSDVRNIATNVDKIAAIIPRVEALENDRTLDKGKMIGVSSIAGAGAGAAILAGWKAIAVKLGF